MKGSIANFFAQEARDGAYALETAGRAGNLDGVWETFRRLEGHLRILEADLSELLVTCSILKPPHY
jgi:hypothetical protein